ncbi:MAG: A/G-specific adenine glycosylase [bacterium]|nr:A/G-specific adenine glycosylase [bacterium]
MREVQQFRRMVWAHYKKCGRHNLPWRKTHDPYRILVSEIMLQQTQVERVIPFYKKFIRQFPTAKKLAAVPLAEVLKSWQGLGYNRRAKMLHQAAKEIEGKKKFPVAELEKLPGIGPYTARAIAAFSWNENVVFVETNIRTAVIHHFFSRRSDVEDTELVEVLKRVLLKGKSRQWYSALMDYGAYLKRSGISHNAKSKTYAKQSKFAGSLRQARGTVLREFTATRFDLTSEFSRSNLIAAVEQTLGKGRRSQIRQALEALIAEGLINESLV